MQRRSFLGGILALAALPHTTWAAEPLQATLICDLASGQPLRQEGPCTSRFTPCSTFKVPLAVMGFDSGLLQDAHQPKWPYKTEYGTFQSDHKLVDPSEWLRDSIVWYSQHLTRQLEMDRFRHYLESFTYGNCDVSGGLTEAWLCNSLQISPQEQVAFVRRLVRGELTASARSQELTRSIMPSFQSKSGWAVQGKTGSGWLGRGQALDKSRPLGWFVGWAKKGDRTVVFARVEVGNQPLQGYAGPQAREHLLENFLP